MNKIKYKKDKLGALKEDIQIRYLGLGWDECKAKWSEGGVTLSSVDLTIFFKDLMIFKKKWAVPENPDVSVPKRRDMSILGQRTNQML